jgi:hypothetical protein
MGCRVAITHGVNRSVVVLELMHRLRRTIAVGPECGEFLAQVGVRRNDPSINVNVHVDTRGLPQLGALARRA